MAIVPPKLAVQGKMTSTKQRILAAMFVCAMAACSGRATGQTVPCATRLQSTAMPGPTAQSAASASLTSETLPTGKPHPSLTLVAPEVPCAPEPLFDVTDSDIKFKIGSLMTTLRDSGHESWVLAAYP